MTVILFKSGFDVARPGAETEEIESKNYMTAHGHFIMRLSVFFKSRSGIFSKFSIAGRPYFMGVPGSLSSLKMIKIT